MQPNILLDFQRTVSDLVTKGFRFTVIHNPDAKTLTIISATKPDMIKHAFPDFNIYLNIHNAKIVEKVFIYA